MAPSKKLKRNVDNCSYVQQLFKQFLDNNRSKKISEVFPQVVSRPVQRFPIEDGGARDNLFQQGVKRHFMKAQLVPVQSNTVKQFFSKPGPNIPQATNPYLANQPIHARFKREEGSDQFVKSDMSPSVAPRGLAQWLNMRKKTADEQRLANLHKERKKKANEYLELPGNFFSGKESLKLPFDAPRNIDKSIMSVGSTFIPPATSTPFDGKPAVNSPILCDPFVELTHRDNIVDDRDKTPQKNFMKDLQMIETVLEQFCDSFLAKECSPLEQNYRVLRELWNEQCAKSFTMSEATKVPSSLQERISWEDHSLISNQMYRQSRQKAQLSIPTEVSILEGTFTDVMVDTISDSFLEVCLPHGSKRKIVDSLLTASPPSPPSILTQTLNQNDLSDAFHDTLHFDFEFTQPSKRAFDEFINFDETRRQEDSFCFFPSTPDEMKYSSTDDAPFFITQKPREASRSSNEMNFLDMFS